MTEEIKFGEIKFDLSAYHSICTCYIGRLCYSHYVAGNGTWDAFNKFYAEHRKLCLQCQAQETRTAELAKKTGINLMPNADSTYTRLRGF